jgi:hypothetical protein
MNVFPEKRMELSHDYTDEIGHQFQMKSAIVSGGNKAS